VISNSHRGHFICHIDFEAGDEVTTARSCEWYYAATKHVGTREIDRLIGDTLT
jgi:hypothetical protein